VRSHQLKMGYHEVRLATYTHRHDETLILHLPPQVPCQMCHIPFKIAAGIGRSTNLAPLHGLSIMANFLRNTMESAKRRDASSHSDIIFRRTGLRKNCQNMGVSTS